MIDKKRDHLPDWESYLPDSETVPKRVLRYRHAMAATGPEGTETVTANSKFKRLFLIALDRYGLTG